MYGSLGPVFFLTNARCLALGGGRADPPRGNKKNWNFRFFDFGALDPLVGTGGPLGPTLEMTDFYDFLKISFFGHNSSLFQSCAILVSPIEFSVFLSIY